MSYKSVKCFPKFENFEYPKELLEWYGKYRDIFTLFLTGPSGVGKTEGIIALLKDLNPLLITDINSLKYLSSNHKAIIFDDINWSKIEREDKIHLLEKVREVDIKIIYQVIRIPADLTKVVISNNPKDLLDLWDEDKAINRRIKHIHLDKPLFKQEANIIINYFEQNKNFN